MAVFIINLMACVSLLLLFFLSSLLGIGSSQQVFDDNLVKEVEHFMGVTPIEDYVVHLDEEINLSLDNYFLG